MSTDILAALADLAEARHQTALALQKEKRKRWRLICGELFYISHEGKVARARASAEAMSHHRWRSLMLQAVNNTDESMLDSLAERLCKVELASGILRAKGYGGHGQSIDLAVRNIPHRQD